jgi:hypothetical protein
VVTWLRPYLRVGGGLGGGGVSTLGLGGGHLLETVGLGLSGLGLVVQQQLEHLGGLVLVQGGVELVD